MPPSGSLVLRIRRSDEPGFSWKHWLPIMVMWALVFGFVAHALFSGTRSSALGWQLFPAPFFCAWLTLILLDSQTGRHINWKTILSGALGFPIAYLLAHVFTPDSDVEYILWGILARAGTRISITGLSPLPLVCGTGSSRDGYWCLAAHVGFHGPGPDSAWPGDRALLWSERAEVRSHAPLLICRSIRGSHIGCCLSKRIAVTGLVVT